ncbi:hypothetical protein [Streptomyces adustus]
MSTERVLPGRPATPSDRSSDPDGNALTSESGKIPASAAVK